MRKKSSSKKDYSSTIVCSAPWRLTKVTPLSNYRIAVEFVDGTCGIVDLQRLIHSLKAGIFFQLKNVDIFNQVHLSYGVATWPGEIDLSPDTMHEHIKKNGQWLVE